MDRDQSTMQQMPTAQAAARPLPCGTGCEAHHPRSGDSLHEDWNAAQLLLELRRSVDTTVYDAAAAAALQEAIRAAAAMAPCCTEGGCRPQPALAPDPAAAEVFVRLQLMRAAHHQRTQTPPLRHMPPQGMMAPPLRPYASPMPAVRTHNNLAAPPLARPTMLLSGPPLGPATPTAYSACHPRWLDCPVTNLAASPIDERRSWP